MQLPEIGSPKQPRDHYLDSSYWLRWVDYTRAQLLDIERPLAQYHDDLVKRTAYRYEFEWRGFNTLVRQLYSGGYSLADVAANVESMFTSVRDLDDDYRAHNPAERYGLYGWGYGNHYELVLQNLCWLVCLGKRHQLHTYVSRCNPAGEDRLYDLICARIAPGRSISNKVAFPKRATPLLAVLAAPQADQSAALVKAYRQWKRRLPNRGLPPEGATAVVDGSYSGYWFWDGALLAALFDIDDGRLTVEANYPGDMTAHFRESRSKGTSKG